MANAIYAPIPQFFGLNGSPLNNGKLYFGTVNLDPETNPVTVYWDEAATLPAAQPIRTTAGYPVRNGQPSPVFVTDNSSIRVRDSGNNQVYYLRDLKSPYNSANSSFLAAGAGAVTRTVQNKLRETVSVTDYGADTTGVASCVAAVDAAIASGAKTITFPPGTYYLPAGAQTVSQYAVAQGDTAIDIPSLYAIMIGSKTGVTIDASQANIVTNSATVFVFYRAVGCRFIGGRFTRTGSDGDINTNQSSAIVITRSADTVAQSVYVDGFYRNLFAYRAPGCGFLSCTSVDALYYNYYCASTIDIAISDYASGSATQQFAKNCMAKRGTFGNFFGEQAVFTGNQSFDIQGFLGGGAHFTSDYGQLVIMQNYISESAVCNGTNAFSGISIAPTLSFMDTVKDCVIQGNIVLGCAFGIKVTGADKFSVVGNYVRGYYATGISLITQVISGINYSVRAGVVTGNTIANIADNSTRTASGNIKICGLQFEENDSLIFMDVACDGNVIDAKGTNTVKTPDYGIYVEATPNTIQFSGNTFGANAPSGFPTWGWAERRTIFRNEFLSTGTAAAPTSISESAHYDGSLILISGANARLLAAQQGMRLFISSTSGAVAVYANGSSSGGVGTDAIYIGGAAATFRNLSFTGPGCLTLVCIQNGVWMVQPGAGTVVTLTP